MKKTEQRIKLARTLLKFRRLGLQETELSVFDVCALIRGSCRNVDEANALFAVWELRRLLYATGKADALRAFERVYLSRAAYVGGDISSRIIKYSFSYHCDPRTVYRQLEYVERLYIKILDQTKKDNAPSNRIAEK